MMEYDELSAAGDEHAPGADLPGLPLVAGYQRLEDAILDESFPEVDLALRRGRHIHKGDERWYRFLSEAHGLLEPFYRRYGCELEQRSDGYFFLLPVGDGLGKRHLGVPEMIVGQGLALCYLDPQSVQSGGLVTREELLNQLAAVMGTDALMHTLNPKRKRLDERVMQRTVRQKVNEALRRLSLLGFVELLEGDQLRLAPSLMRFAEPVRGLDAPSEALARLIERGEVSLGPGDAEPREDDELDELDASDELPGPLPEASDALAGAGEGDFLEERAAMVDEDESAPRPAAPASDADEAALLDESAPVGEAARVEDSEPVDAGAPRPALASPAATYEGFPANDASHVEAGTVEGTDEDDAAEGDAAEGATAAEETAPPAGATAPPPLDPVDIEFDWDTLPDEEA